MLRIHSPTCKTPASFQNTQAIDTNHTIISHYFMHYLKNLIIGLCLFFCYSSLSAQTAAIKGFVKDKETGQAVIFMVVALEGTTHGTQTDENGYYSLTKLPAGSYTLLIADLNFKEVREQITLKDGQVMSRNYMLDAADNQTINGVEITGDRANQLDNINIGSETIRTADIKSVPSIGGQPDLAQYLTNIPGIITTGDQGGQLYVRGGSPIQNKVLLDGMIVYNAFHSIGLFSVFDTELISSADVYTGGFSSQYGGRISSVMDITTRDGNKGGTTGRVGINPFALRAHVEGPLRKLQPNGSGISYILSAKRSHLDVVSPGLYPYVNEGEGLPFTFTDLYGKLSFGGGNGSKFNLFGFSFNDGVKKYQNLGELSWTNNGAGANFVVVPSSSSVLISGNFAYSAYDIALREENLPDRTSSIKGFNAGLEFKYIIEKDVLKYGVEIVGFDTDYQTFTLADATRQVGVSESTTELNSFVDYKFNRNDWIVEPSLRLQFYGSLGVFSPEPRIGIKYKASEVLRLKAAAGVYTQNLMATNSDRDVVNLFYGFLAAPQNLPATYTAANGEVREVNNSLQRANHYIVGAEYDLTERWNINIESYFKDFRQLTNPNRNKVYSDDASNFDKPDVLKKDYLIETGWAAGADLAVKYEDKRFYLWLVYSLTKVNRWDGFKYYSPVFDRRHNANVVATYKFGKKKVKEYEFSVRWNLGSGLPFTQTQGFYQPQGVSGGVALDYITDNPSQLGIQFAPLNGGRLPYYHRLDMNLRRSLELKGKLKMELNAGITNVYNRANVFYIDRITAQRVDQLPIIPTIGVDLSF
ncbi:MAG: TonB-dependent receptor [Flavobacteriales bacterium]